MSCSLLEPMLLPSTWIVLPSVSVLFTQDDEEAIMQLEYAIEEVSVFDQLLVRVIANEAYVIIIFLSDERHR